MWRKTRSLTSGSTCIGVDPNRNWDAGFGSKAQCGLGSRDGTPQNGFLLSFVLSSPNPLLPQQWRHMGNVGLSSKVHSEEGGPLRSACPLPVKSFPMELRSETNLLVV